MSDQQTFLQWNQLQNELQQLQQQHNLSQQHQQSQPLHEPNYHQRHCAQPLQQQFQSPLAQSSQDAVFKQQLPEEQQQAWHMLATVSDVNIKNEREPPPYGAINQTWGQCSYSLLTFSSK